MEHSISVVKKSAYISKIAISTDSHSIRRIATKENVWCDKLRPKKYSTDKSSTYQAVKFVIDNINYKPDIIIELHPTYIFRNSKTIDSCIKKLLSKKKFDSLISIQKIEDTSHPDFVIDLYQDNINYKKSPTQFNRHYLKAKYRSLGYILISRIKSFYARKSMIGKKCIGFEVKNKKEIIDINNKLDFKFAESIYLDKEKKY